MKPRHWIRNIFLQLSKKPAIIVFFADIVKVQKISVIVIFFTHLVITGFNIAVGVDPSVSTIRNNICRKTKEATRMWSSHSERSAHQSGGYHWPHLHSHIPSASGGWDRRRAGHCGNTGQSAAPRHYQQCISCKAVYQDGNLGKISRIVCISLDSTWLLALPPPLPAWTEDAFRNDIIRAGVRPGPEVW